ncbi:DUF4179 domain-containing protein [Clostridium sp. Marseille-QA1073]
MKDKFEMMNDMVVDLNEYEVCELNDIEKKQIKKRLKPKIKNKNSKKKIAVIVIALGLGYIGIVSNISVLADIPLIGSVIEEYVNSKGKSLEDYKTIVHETEVDSEITVKLNEVVLDAGQLIISSTFKSNKVNIDDLYASPTVYINGSEVSKNGCGSNKKIDDNTYNMFSNINLGNIDMKDNLDIKIVYENIRVNTMLGKYKHLPGKWSFEISSSPEKLISDMKTIAINKEFKLDNGQEIKVEDLIITPISTKLDYKMIKENKNDVTFKYDVQFKVEDESGNEFKFISGTTAAENSHLRFETLDDNIKRLKITPYVISGEEGEKKTDYYKVLYDEVFYVEIK